MSRIDDLIAKYCPDGVEYKELQEIFITRNGYTPLTTNKAYWTNGTIPWFRMEDIRANGNILSESMQLITEDAVKGGKLFPANSILVATSATIGEHALITVPHLSNQRFTSLSLKPAFEKRLDMRFVYYYCFELDRWCLANTTTSSFSSVNMTGFKSFKFPVPPLEIQKEIVDILDAFTKLEAELEAELEARRQQYAHYRYELLNFSEDEVEWKTLDDIVSFRRGSFPQPYGNSNWYDGEGSMPFVQVADVSDHGFTLNSHTKQRISKLAQLKSVFVKAGTVIVTLQGTIGRVAITPYDSYVDRTLAIFTDYKDNISKKYFAYQLKNKFDIEKEFARGSTLKTITKEEFSKFEIPVPSLDEQERIVTILDKFDALVNDISSGLPAEIAARRQQYEHYRNQLLTFQEAA
jgi:type I restriction enzyme S subunit